MAGSEIYVFLIITGLVFFVWLFALVRQTQRGFSGDLHTLPRPVVPINLLEADEAVVVAEGRGRIVYVNDAARKWFGIDGSAPNLAMIAQAVHPSDTFHDLLAATGHASLRLGQRQIEAVSHAIPSMDGTRMVVVMRELTGDAIAAYSDFDPMQALTVLDDLSGTFGREAQFDLQDTIDSIVASLGDAIAFDAAEVTLWHAETETLRPVGRSLVRTATGSLIPPDQRTEVVYRMGEGYTGWIAMYRQPLLINNVSGRTDIHPKPSSDPFQSFVGIPLVVGDQFIGTLELTHKQRNAFTQRDLGLLRALDGQIASAIQAARLYNSQRLRVLELDGLQQIAQAMGQLGTPSELYGQLTERIAQLVGVQMCGVLLYEEDEDVFRSQLPFYGVMTHLIAHFRTKLAADSDLYTIWYHRPWWFSNAPDRDMLRGMGFEDLVSAMDVSTIALVPMIIGTRRIGLLLTANRIDEHGFDEEDMPMLISFAGQAAVVAENARLYHEEQRRNRELGGLQQIAQAIGVLRNTEELYGQITERIGTLMNVALCGILLYDIKTRVLVSQQPFYGMDAEQVSFFQLPSPPESAVAALWMARTTWFSNDLRRDPLARDSDLVTLSSQMGIRQAVLATLAVGGNRLGVILVANRQDGFEFSDDDARILSIFAGQAAILVDNARLYSEMQTRTHEAEGLRAVTEIVSQPSPDDTTVENVLVAIANLLEVAVVAVALVDEASGELVFQPHYVFGAQLIKEHRIDTYTSGFAESVLISRRSFLSADVRTDNRVLFVYQPVIQQLGLHDVIQVPLIIHERGVGELTVANRTTEQPFTNNDVQLLEAIANQVAAMVDRMRMQAATDFDLLSRIQELDALGRVSHELSQTLELDRVLEVIRQEALRSTEASATSIVLLVPRVAWHEDGTPILERRFGEGRALRDLTPIEIAAVKRNDVIAVGNYQSSEFEAIPPHTQSALVVPINYGEDVMGLIHLFSSAPEVFDQGVIEFVLALTDQATVAIGNARRYQEQLQMNDRLRVRAERMGRIFELGEMFQQRVPLAEMLEEVAHSIQETVGYNVVMISLVDEREAILRRTAQAGLPLAAFEEMQAITPPVTQALNLMQEQFRISNSYFLPAEGTQELLENVPVYRVLTEAAAQGARAWDPEDLLLIPLRGTAQRLAGIISVDEPRNGLRPDMNTIEALEIFANQAAFSIENYRLIQRIREEAEASRRERDRLAQLHLVASEIQNAPDVPSRLQIVADGIHDAGWGHVVITLHDEHLEPTALIQSGYDADRALTLSDEVPPGSVWRGWINDLQFHELKLGAGYYMRYSEPWVQAHVLKDQTIEPPQVAEDEWHPQDVMFLPLVGQDQARIIGMIAMDSPADGKVPTQDSLRPFELFASQAAAAIERTRLYLETVRAAEQEQRLNEVMEAVSGSISPDAIIESLGRGLQQMVPFTRMCLAMHNARTDQFDILNAEIALDMSVKVSPGGVMELKGTAMGLTYREMTPRVMALGKDVTSREVFNDLRGWFADGERSTLIIPMIAGGQAIGVLHLGSELENAFGFQENIGLIQRLANLSAVALDNARLFESAQSRAVQLDAQAQRLATLNELANQLAQALVPEEIYSIALQQMQTSLTAPYGAVIMYDDNLSVATMVYDTHPMAPIGALPRIEMTGDATFTDLQAQLTPIAATDAQHEPLFAPIQSLLKRRATQSLLAVPLVVADRVIGSIALEFPEARTFTDDEIGLAQTFAGQISVALEKTRLLSETQEYAFEMNQQANRMMLVNRVSNQLAQTLDPTEIYEIVLIELQQVLGAAFGGFLLFGEDEGTLVADTHPDFDPHELRTLPLEGNPSIRQILDTHQPLVSVDAQEDPLFELAWAQFKERGTKSLLIIPLLVGEVVLGTIGIDFTERRELSDDEIGLATIIANQAALAIEKARLYDETLGLTIFNQSVVESIQQGIVVLDIDLRVRRVNRYMIDRYGWSMAAVGQTLFEFRPDYSEFLREAIAIVLTVGEPQVRYDVRRKDEQGLPSIRNYYIYPMQEGREITGIVLLLEDVTERAKLEADLETRAIQMAALTEVSGQITSKLEPQQVIDIVLDALDRVLPYDGVSLWLRTPGVEDQLHIAAARGYTDSDAGVEQLIGLTVEIPYSALFREMAANVRVINAVDVAADTQRFPYGSEAPYKNWLGAPLISAGKVMGVLALEKREPHFYDALYEQLALTFANQTAVALNNAQLFTETRARAAELDDQAQRLALLNRVSLALAQTLDIENIYEIALREAAIALAVEEGSALTIDTATNLASVIVDYPRGDEPPDSVFDATRNEAINRVCEGLLPLVVELKGRDDLAQSLRTLTHNDNVVSSLLVPLVVGGEVIGVLRLNALDERHQFRRDQIELAQTIASQAATAAQNASLFEQGQIRTSELETLFESAQATAVTLDLDEVLRRVTIQMLTAVNADACAVFLWDEVNDRLILRGEISSRTEEEGETGQVYSLRQYPLRERALRERQLLAVRIDDEALPERERELFELHQASSRLLIPLVVNEISIGLVELEMIDPSRYFRAETARLARTLASQAAISIENARLQTETRRTVEELYIINDMSSALSSASNLQALLEVLDLQLPSLTDAQIIYVALYDPVLQSLEFPMAQDVRTEQSLEILPLSLGQDEFSLVIKQQAPLLLVGEHLKEVRRSLGIQTVMNDTSAFLGVPLGAGEDVVGVLGIRDDTDVIAFGHNDQRVLTTVGAQLAVAIQSTRLLEQTVQLAEELDERVRERTQELEIERQQLSILYQITTELSTSLDMEKLLNRALEMVAKAVGATQGAILAVDPIANRLYFRSQIGWAEIYDEKGESPTLRLNEGLAGWVIQQHQSTIIENVQEDARWLTLGPADQIPRGAMVAPIESTEDVLGVMMLLSEKPAAFSEDHLRLVTAAASQVAAAMNNAELYSLIRDQAERLGAMLREQQVESTKSRAILDSVADGVMVADPQGEVIIFNHTAEEVLRVPSRNIIGRPASQIAGLYGTGQTRWAATVERWMLDPTLIEHGDVLEEEISLEDERIIDVRLAPVWMGDQFLGTVSIFRDITRMVEVDRLKSEFVATVSHELRTPMTSIKGYADLLLLGAAGGISEQQQRFLETIKQNADRLSILVNDLLDISRIDQGRMELRFSTVDVGDLFNGLAVHLRGRSEDEKRAMNVIIDLPDDQHLRVWGDYDKVAQILSNLGDNAFNYTPAGGTITLSAREGDAQESVILQVIDTGIGIPPEAGDRVFERFFRGDETHDLVMDTPGTGLGLAIVRELVEVHYGNIWFDSEVGVGTTFYVELPTKPNQPLLAGASSEESA